MELELPNLVFTSFIDKNSEGIGMELEGALNKNDNKSAIFNPLKSLNKNISNTFHDKLDILRENEEIQIWNRRRLKDSPLKTDFKNNPNEDYQIKAGISGFGRTKETETQSAYMSLTNTNRQLKASVRGKENVESCSIRIRSCFRSSKMSSNIRRKGSGSLIGHLNAKLFQQGRGSSNSSLCEVDVNIPDEIDDQQDVGNADFLEGLQYASPQKSEFYEDMKDDCSSISDGSQTSAAPLLVVQPHEDAITSDSLQNTESANFSCFTDIESLDVPVASQVQCASKYTSSSTKISRGTELLLHKSKNALGACPEAARSLQNASNLHCGEISHGLLTYSVLSQSQGNQDTQIGENVREGHTVVFFSPQKYLQENAAKCNTDNFSNLYSIYILYYHNIMCWIKRTFGKKAITRQVHRLKQIFSPSSRGFVYLDSQKSPKFPHNATYSKKKMANDDELRAVLLKINDVLTSMDRDSVVSDLARKCKIEHQTS